LFIIGFSRIPVCDSILRKESSWGISGHGKRGVKVKEIGYKKPDPQELFKKRCEYMLIHPRTMKIVLLPNDPAFRTSDLRGTEIFFPVITVDALFQGGGIQYNRTESTPSTIPPENRV
jgi:hypothetical protein